MQKHGYEIMKADSDEWIVAKLDDVGNTAVPVTSVELKELLVIEEKKAFDKRLHQLSQKPLWNRSRPR